MISLIFKLLSFPREWYNRRNAKKNATFLGEAQILQGAHFRSFCGSTKNDIVIDDDFRFFSGTIVSQNGGKITIGKHSKIGFDCKVLSAKFIKIGDYVLIADSVTICDNNNHPVNPLDRAIVYRTPWDSEYRRWKYSQSNPIIINNNVWIGSNVRICKGVTIGEGAVIAACSVVTKDVPANCIAAGNPAKIVKTEINKLPRMLSDDILNKY